MKIPDFPYRSPTGTPLTVRARYTPDPQTQVGPVWVSLGYGALSAYPDVDASIVALLRGLADDIEALLIVKERRERLMAAIAQEPDLNPEEDAALDQLDAKAEEVEG